FLFFFFQAEDGIRDRNVTGVQTCALPIYTHSVEQMGQSPDFRKKLWIAFGITAFIIVVQLVGAVLTGSLALLTDTVHAITDASGDRKSRRVGKEWRPSGSAQQYGRSVEAR